MKSNQKKQPKEVYDKKFNRKILLSDEDAKKYIFFQYRLFYPLALAVVLKALFSFLNVYLLVAAVVIIMILLELSNQKFMKELVILKQTSVINDSRSSKTVEYLKVRFVIYTLLGLAIIITTIIQNYKNFEMNSIVLIVIGGMAIFTGVNSLKK